MKRMKKLACLLLALAAVLCLSTAAFADTTTETPAPGYTTAKVTLPTASYLSGHTFTAYQIFSGTQAETEGGLGDVQWGSGIDSTKFLAALVADTTLKTGDTADFNETMTAADVAKVLSTYTDQSVKANAVARIASSCITNSGTVLNQGDNLIPIGYYLVVDSTESVGEGSAYNASVLLITDNMTIESKTDVPTLKKKVKEDDKCDDVTWSAGYNDVADYSIGETVSFELLSQIPHLDYYTTYTYTFYDTLSAGFDKPSNFQVYLSSSRNLDATGVVKYPITESFGTPTVTKNADGTWDIQLSCSDIKSIVVDSDAGTTLAQVVRNAMHPASGSPQNMFIVVQYDAVLNNTAVIGLPGNPNEAYLEYSNNPDGEGIGTTPKDKVIVYSYELDVTKKANDATKGDPLQGVKFVLLNDKKTQVAKVVDGKFVEWLAIPGEGEAWNDTTTLVTGADGKTWPGDTVLTTGTDGKVSVTGLDSGIYYLWEIETLPGYNRLTGDIRVTITANTRNGGDLDAGTAGLNNLTVKLVYLENSNEITTRDGDGNANNGTVGITVVNNAGASLPETGGMGTTLFYLVGGALALGAAVLLITRRRVGARR